jgi:hypothetical protein
VGRWVLDKWGVEQEQVGFLFSLDFFMSTADPYPPAAPLFHSALCADTAAQLQLTPQHAQLLTQLNKTLCCFAAECFLQHRPRKFQKLITRYKYVLLSKPLSAIIHGKMGYVSRVGLNVLTNWKQSANIANGL